MIIIDKQMTGERAFINVTYLGSEDHEHGFHLEKCSELVRYILEDNMKKVKERINDFPEEINKKVDGHWMRGGGESPLILMCKISRKGGYISRLEIISLLIEKGADVNIKNDNSDSALYSAAYHLREDERYEIMKILLENGADINAKNGDGLTALHLVALNGTYREIDLLLKYGADLKIKERIFGRNVIGYLDNEVDNDMEIGTLGRILLNRIHLFEYKQNKKMKKIMQDMSEIRESIKELGKGINEIKADNNFCFSSSDSNNAE